MSTAKAATATAELKAEHRVIQRVLVVLEKLVGNMQQGGEPQLSLLTQSVEFFRLYADACHHAKEEDLLFPVLEERGVPREGGPIGVMLEEHRMARALVARMATAVDDLKAKGGDSAKNAFCDAARDYLHLLTQHIYKEDNVLFEIGDQVMAESDQAELAAGFCDVACRDFDGKTRDQLEEIANQLEQSV